MSPDAGSLDPTAIPPAEAAPAPSGARRRWLYVLGAALVVFDVVLLALDHRMKTAGGPGIIGFEFAGSHAKATRILAEWGPAGRRAARASLWLDYPFMLVYGAFFALAGLATRDLARSRGWRSLTAAGAVVPFFAIGAAAFDAVEDVALLLMLGGHGGGFAPPFAAVCSTFKFALILTAIAYVLVGLAWRLRPRAAATP